MGNNHEDSSNSNKDIYTYDNSSSQNTNQHKESNDNSTYWESNKIQNSYETLPAQNEDNNSYNQEPSNLTNNEFNNNPYQIEEKKRSKAKPVIASLIVVFILLAITASAYAINGTFRNSIDLLLKSPRDYYASIENRNIGNVVDKSIAYSNMSKKESKPLKIAANLSYDKDTVGALLQESLGMTISDLETYLGIPLDSVGFDLVTAENDDGIYQNIALLLNSTAIISGEIFTDPASSEMLFHLPELSPAYLKQSMDTGEFAAQDLDLAGFSEAMNKLSSNDTGEAIKRYIKLIIDEIDDVDLKKNVMLTVGDLTVETNLLEVHFYPETLKNTITKVMAEIKKDEYILSYLPLFDITKDEFINRLDKDTEEALNRLDNLRQDEEIMSMKVYVGSDGTILGRSIDLINVHDKTITIAFSNLKHNNKEAYEFYINEDGKENGFHLMGNHSVKDKAYNGLMTIELLSNDNLPVEFEIEYENLRLKHNKGNINIYGSINLSSYTMMGMEALIELDVKDDIQYATLKLNMGRTSLVTIETSYEYIEDLTIPKPNKNADTFDILTESDKYVATINLEDYISVLSERLGVDLEGLAGFFLPFY